MKDRRLLNHGDIEAKNVDAHGWALEYKAIFEMIAAMAEHLERIPGPDMIRKRQATAIKKAAWRAAERQFQISEKKIGGMRKAKP
jgi:hypothetical protein